MWDDFSHVSCDISNPRAPMGRQATAQTQRVESRWFELCAMQRAGHIRNLQRRDTGRAAPASRWRNASPAPHAAHDAPEKATPPKRRLRKALFVYEVRHASAAGTAAEWEAISESPTSVMARKAASIGAAAKGEAQPWQTPGQKRANKFNAERVTVDGIDFDSKHEAERWSQLQLLQSAGQIRALTRQVPIFLQGQQGPLLTRTGRPMRLTVDFAYEDRAAAWALVYEDAKGKPTRDYEVRRAAAQAMGIEVREV